MEHLNSIRAALRGAAPVVAIPVPGHAPAHSGITTLRKMTWTFLSRALIPWALESSSTGLAMSGRKTLTRFDREPTNHREE
jgi:hypothetical protein